MKKIPIIYILFLNAFALIMSVAVFNKDAQLNTALKALFLAVFIIDFVFLLCMYQRKSDTKNKTYTLARNYFLGDKILVKLKKQNTLLDTIFGEGRPIEVKVVNTCAGKYYKVESQNVNAWIDEDEIVGLVYYNEKEAIK